MSRQQFVHFLLWALSTTYVSSFSRPGSRSRSGSLPFLRAENYVAASTKRTAPSDVVTIFDDFADHFEAKLSNLDYCAPSEVAKAAVRRISDARQGRPYQSALDAGCGTGLSGPHLWPLVKGLLIGVDLSPKMAELAAELLVDNGPVPVAKDRMRRCDEAARSALGNPARLYDGVFIADLLEMEKAAPLEGYGQVVKEMPLSFDLITSADVMCYFGEMGGVLRALSQMLSPGGDLIFTCETVAEGDYNWIRQPSDRYAHFPGYVAKMAADTGLVVVEQRPFTPRLEAGEKVLGTLHVFHKPL